MMIGKKREKGEEKGDFVFELVRKEDVVRSIRYSFMMMMMYSYSDMSPAVGRPTRAKLSKLCYMENLFQV